MFIKNFIMIYKITSITKKNVFSFVDFSNNISTLIALKGV